MKNFVVADGIKETKESSKEPAKSKILKVNPPVPKETGSPAAVGALKVEKSVEVPIPKNNNQGISGDHIENIMTENELLKRRLELSSKIIGLLQYKMQGESISAPEYLFANRFPEQFLRYQFFNQQQQLDHQQQNY